MNQPTEENLEFTEHRFAFKTCEGFWFAPVFTPDGKPYFQKFGEPLPDWAPSPFVKLDEEEP
jgi:hypothetical protein